MLPPANSRSATSPLIELMAPAEPGSQGTRPQREGASLHPGPRGPAPERGLAALTERPGRPLVSVVIPVYNERENLGKLLDELGGVLAEITSHAFEVLVVDDGSDDGSAELAAASGARVVRHPVNLGNGAAVKRGIREARGDWILLMDGDGQHPPGAISLLLARAQQYDMIVGSREGGGGPMHRNLANRIYNALASYVTGRRIRDLTSGFRLVRAGPLKSFVDLLPNTFSYPTTITLAMLKAGYSVCYTPFRVRRRRGSSKIRLLEDGSRFFLIILKVATFFAPLRVFVPLSFFVGSLGVGWYLYTWLTTHRFTNMAVLLLVQAGVLFSLGLISEQIAQMRLDRGGVPRPAGAGGGGRGNEPTLHRAQALAGDPVGTRVNSTGHPETAPAGDCDAPRGRN